MSSEQMKGIIEVANEKAKAALIKKYPNLTLSKFRFVTTVNHDGSVNETIVYFIKLDGSRVDISTNTFRNDMSMWGWLHVNADKYHLDTLDGPTHKRNTVFYEKQLRSYDKDMLPIALIVIGVLTAGYFLMSSEKRKRKKSKKNRGK